MIRLNTVYGYEDVRDYYYLSNKKIYNAERDSYLDNRKTTIKLRLTHGGTIYCNPKNITPTKITPNLIKAVVLFIAQQKERFEYKESYDEAIIKDTKNKFMLSTYQLNKILGMGWKNVNDK